MREGGMKQSSDLVERNGINRILKKNGKSHTGFGGPNSTSGEAPSFHILFKPSPNILKKIFDLKLKHNRKENESNDSKEGKPKKYHIETKIQHKNR